jgi:hypothetical protein
MFFKFKFNFNFSTSYLINTKKFIFLCRIEFFLKSFEFDQNKSTNNFLKLISYSPIIYLIYVKEFILEMQFQ